MLLANLDIEVSQEAVAEAGGATELIELNGMRVDQLARAISSLAPQVTFWWKDHASIEDLVTLIKQYEFPAGVEWQGVFEEDDEEKGENPLTSENAETGDTDYGHYSIVTYIDPEKGQLIIADPYKDYIAQARIFTITEFEHRWYDWNETLDPITGKTVLMEDFHMLFIIAPKDVQFPKELGMKSDLFCYN
jgi:hypothetical protein